MWCGAGVRTSFDLTAIARAMITPKTASSPASPRWRRTAVLELSIGRPHLGASDPWCFGIDV